MAITIASTWLIVALAQATIQGNPRGVVEAAPPPHSIELTDTEQNRLHAVACRQTSAGYRLLRTYTSEYFLVKAGKTLPHAPMSAADMPDGLFAQTLCEQDFSGERPAHATEGMCRTSNAQWQCEEQNYAIELLRGVKVLIPSEPAISFAARVDIIKRVMDKDSFPWSIYTRFGVVLRADVRVANGRAELQVSDLLDTAKVGAYRVPLIYRLCDGEICRFDPS